MRLAWQLTKGVPIPDPGNSSLVRKATTKSIIFPLVKGAFGIAQEELMLFRRRRRGTIIEEGLKITGSVSAEGLVEINGRIEGDVHCSSLIISPKAAISGGVEADKVLVDGRVEGPIRGSEVVLKSHAHVVGDIHHQLLLNRTRCLFRGAVGMLVANRWRKSVGKTHHETAEGDGAESNTRASGCSCALMPLSDFSQALLIDVNTLLALAVTILLMPGFDLAG